MTRGLALALTTSVGGLAAIQAALNSQLGRKVGTFQAALVSFAVGTIILVAIAAFSQGGLGRIGEARHVAWYYLLGGLLGACYVSCLLVTVRTLGAGGMTACVVAGQLTMSVLLDQLGILGIAKQPVTAAKLAGIALLAGGVFLILRD